MELETGIGKIVQASDCTSGVRVHGPLGLNDPEMDGL